MPTRHPGFPSEVLGGLQSLCACQTLLLKEVAVSWVSSLGNTKVVHVYESDDIKPLKSRRNKATYVVYVYFTAKYR